jgi:hypothetical protein
MSSMLPIELYRIICENLDRPSLFSVVVASRTFQAEAERLLHMHVSLGPDYAHATLACQTALKIPRFLPLIQYLHVLDQIWITRPFRTDDFACPTPIHRLLEQTPNVILLSLSTEWRRCDRVFLQTSFQLRVLRCDFTIDHDFVEFLTQQPSIFELDWFSDATPVSELPVQALRNLETLYIRTHLSPHVAAEVITGRPVKHLSCGHVTVSHLEKGFALSAGPLIALRVFEFDCETLKALPRFCPHLQYLGVITYDTISVESLIPDIPILISTDHNLNQEDEFLTDVLPAFKYLDSLEMSEWEVEDLDASDGTGISWMQQVNLRTIMEVHAACPSIVRIQGDDLDTESGILWEWDNDLNSFRPTQTRHDLYRATIERLVNI